MKVMVTTTGILDEYLPPGSSVPAEIGIKQGATPVDVIRILGMPEEGRYLVSVNGAIVRRADQAEFILSDNDDLAIMPPLKGG